MTNRDELRELAKRMLEAAKDRVNEGLEIGTEKPLSANDFRSFTDFLKFAEKSNLFDEEQGRLHSILNKLKEAENKQADGTGG